MTKLVAACYKLIYANPCWQALHSLEKPQKQEHQIGTYLAIPCLICSLQQTQACFTRGMMFFLILHVLVDIHYVCSLNVFVHSGLLVSVLYFSWENILTSQLPSCIAMQSNVSVMFSPKCITTICVYVTYEKCDASHKANSIHWFCNIC